MPLRIGFDLDGVLADMDGALAHHATTLFGDRVASQAPAAAGPPAPDEGGDGEPQGEMSPFSTLQLSARQESKLWRHVRGIDGFWESLKEIEPGIVARLAALAASRRWDIIFLTKRPESAGLTAQTQSQRWLQKLGFPLPSVYVVQGSRGRIAAALDLEVVVDDRPENCLDVVADSTARALLVWRAGETLLPAAVKRLGVGTARSVGDVLDLLSKIDAPAPASGGVVDRMMKMLGMKGSAADA
jgi:hypothetical protein